MCLAMGHSEEVSLFSYHRKTHTFYMAPRAHTPMLHAFIKNKHLRISSCKQH